MKSHEIRPNGKGVPAPGTVQVPANPVEDHREAGLTDKQCVEIYRYMLLARTLDERMWVLNRQGRVPFVVSGQGHEAAQVGAAMALRRDRDWLLPYYRDYALVLYWGFSPRDIMLGVFGKAEDPSSGGRQMPAHWGSSRLRIASQSSPVGTQVPQAVGVALASAIRGEDAVTLVSFGEGSASQGDTHEGMNFAAVHRLPVIFFCENNSYAISVPQSKQMGVKSVAERAQGYGFPGVTVDGTDPVAVYVATRDAVERARGGEGASLVEARVPRLTPHSSDDDDRSYRSAEELTRLKELDPLTRFRSHLLDNGLISQGQCDELTREVQRQVDEATRYAQEAAYPDPSTLGRFVYSEGGPADGR